MDRTGEIVNHLSLYTGAGGGELAALLLGWRTVGYVEYDDYCQKVIVQRIKDGILPEAPIFGDVKAFTRDGYAASYTGMVDVLSGGFPCQPFSTAGKQLGADDNRNMWPATADVVQIVRPRYCLLENVPGIRPYLSVVIRDLRRLGYTVRRPLQLGADDVGAPHRRKRVWILAHTDGKRHSQNMGTPLPWRQDTPTSNPQPSSRSPDRSAIFPGSKQENVADTTEKGFPILQRRGQDAQLTRHRTACGAGWWAVEPELGRVAHGIPHRVDRLKATGNAQVPIVAATAWRILLITRERAGLARQDGGSTEYRPSPTGRRSGR